jgi:hypothetical protein
VTNQMNRPFHRYVSFIKKHTKSSLLVVVIAVYSLAGFVLAPWFLQKNLQEFVQGSYQSELRIEKIDVNPFALSLGIQGLARISHPLSSRGGERWYLTYLYSGHPALHPLG